MSSELTRNKLPRDIILHIFSFLEVPIIIDYVITIKIYEEERSSGSA